LVDDEPEVTSAMQAALRKEPFKIECTDSGEKALDMLARQAFDVVVSDERMPSMSGSRLLSIVRQEHPDIVRIILSGQASFEAALRAINGAEIYRFLMKPCPPEEIGLTIREALAARDERRRFAAWRAEQAQHEPSVLARGFERSLETLWMAFQRITDAKTMKVFGYEALMRSDDPKWHNALAFCALTEKLGRSAELGRRIRALVAERIPEAPADMTFFVNVNPDELRDESLIAALEPLGLHAKRVVLEITERASLAEITDLDVRVQRLRAAGYRIAIDDIGAGYSGLSNLTLLAPDIVKFDMDLIREIHRSPTKQKVVGPMIRMCKDLGIQTLAEGVEKREELDAVVALGCDFLQGYFLGRPARDIT
jgi:EAL domain-containing protein (putative c-di-GMP-specific phosphodiesterase class I)